MSDRSARRAQEPLVDLDVNGHQLSVSERDMKWLGKQAANAAGRSSRASELAARLSAISSPRHLLFGKAEARALFDALNCATDVPPGLHELADVLQKTFPAASHGPRAPNAIDDLA